MSNPFIENSFLLPNASVNKLKIAKITNLEDKNILNKHAMELFSSSILHNSIYSFLLSHGISFDENNMFSIFKEYLGTAEDNALFLSQPNQNSSTELAQNPAKNTQDFIAKFLGAHNVLKQLGKNLACILLTLYEGLDENKNLRDDWDNRHWDYWHSIKKVILCGGMMQDIIGETIAHYADDFFDDIGKHPYRISRATSDLPIIGACKYASLRSENSVVFDFGHSYIKRGYYKRDNDSFLINILISEKSQHLDLDENPRLLDDFLFKIILNTLNEMPTDIIQGPVIAASIANYINDGDIYEKRGNYAKLKMLTPNYQKHLSSRLKEKLGRDMEIILMHDGSAAAYAINEDRCAVLTLGTAIGVGFTNENFDFTYRLT